jgi:NitT/TauT family transport system permease protein
VEWSALPIAMLLLGLLAWELIVRVRGIPPYVLPAPELVFRTLVSDWAILGASLARTLVTTFEGFAPWVAWGSP